MCVCGLKIVVWLVWIEQCVWCVSVCVCVCVCVLNSVCVWIVYSACTAKKKNA